MNVSQIYIVITIIVIAIILIVMLVVKKQKPEKKLTTLAALSFCFVIAGLFSGENRLIGYSLIGIGIILAVVDIMKSRS
jgi:hypothetical protein